MKTELEQKLYKDFPQLFNNEQEPKFRWGCSCSDGWYKLIHDTCSKLMELNPPKNFKFVQVKEKFGGLRLYCRGGNEKLHQIIFNAEAESHNICEWCSSTEDVTLDGKGWISSLCQTCHEKRKEGYRPWLKEE